MRLMKKLWLTITIALAAGCAGDPDAKFARELMKMRAMEPPTFLTGDLALLYGTANFSARAELQRAPSGSRPPLRGELSGLNGKLFFIADEQRLARGMAGGLSAFWDGPAQTGYLLNEPLQGYAPIQAANTNSPLEIAVIGDETLNGEATVKSIASLRVGSELIPQFIVWRSKGHGNLPVLIQTTNRPANLSLSLSRVRLTPPPAELFELPSGFRKYESTDVMMGELIRRQRMQMQGGRHDRGTWDSDNNNTAPFTPRTGVPPGY